jgi:hypothetical protein
VADEGSYVKFFIYCNLTKSHPQCSLRGPKRKKHVKTPMFQVDDRVYERHIIFEIRRLGIVTRLDEFEGELLYVVKFADGTDQAFLESELFRPSPPNSQTPFP